MVASHVMLARDAAGALARGAVASSMSPKAMFDALEVNAKNAVAKNEEHDDCIACRG